ncbi:hypothetical protein [Archangium sp.]|uniref:hypothetical protein n=1 Tax=Archangium sp. TaxID=1872627 RepID=UPI002D3950F1|nr:hypothetical protein [Archangium sp.]HYO56208.1 hypothetical protein [Archangium sp.]
MKTGMMGSRRSGRFVVALGAMSLGLLVTGCDVGRDIPDAGVACADLLHHEMLGTLQLQPGFAATESAALPDAISAVTAVRSGPGYKLYGLGGTGKSLHELGTWPNVTLGGTALQSIIAEADRGETTYSSGFLTNDGTRLLAGYTKPGSLTNTPGTVLVYDTASPDKSTYMSAPGNYSAAAISGYFFINGQGIQGSASSGNAVYALKTETSPFQGSRLATFPEADVFSSAMAVTSTGVAVFGYGKYDAAEKKTINRLRAVAPATYSPALTSGTALALSDSNAPEIYSGTDFFSAASFGEGVAIHRGSYDPTTFEAFTTGLSRIELTTGGIDPKSVTAGEPESVLTTHDTCTHVVELTPMGSDLLVGVQDKNGRRLVRIRKQ